MMGEAPAGREVACPECGETVIGDPPIRWDRGPCSNCGYSGEQA